MGQARFDTPSLFCHFFCLPRLPNANANARLPIPSQKPPRPELPTPRRFPARLPSHRFFGVPHWGTKPLYACVSQCRFLGSRDVTLARQGQNCKLPVLSIHLCQPISRWQRVKETLTWAVVRWPMIGHDDGARARGFTLATARVSQITQPGPGSAREERSAVWVG